MKKHKFRVIKKVGSTYQVEFMKGKIIKKDGQSLIQVGFFKKKYLPFTSVMTDFDENLNPIEPTLSKGLHMDIPLDVLRWNIIMKAQAHAEHTKISFWQEYKPWIFTALIVVAYFGFMFWVGSGFNTVVNESQVWVSKMDVLMGAV